MKKIFLFMACVLLFSGCGEQKRGSLTIINKSSYDVEFVVGENYNEHTFILNPDKEKKIDWEHYVLPYVSNPKNIIEFELTKNPIIVNNKFSDKNKPYLHIITTDLENIRLNSYFLDSNHNKIETYIFLDDSSFEYRNDCQISLSTGSENRVYCSKKIMESDILIDKGTSLTISSAESQSGKEEKSFQFVKRNNKFYINEIKTDNTGKKYFQEYEIQIEIKTSEKYFLVSFKKLG